MQYPGLSGTAIYELALMSDSDTVEKDSDQLETVVDSVLLCINFTPRIEWEFRLPSPMALEV